MRVNENCHMESAYLYTSLCSRAHLSLPLPPSQLVFLSRPSHSPDDATLQLRLRNGTRGQVNAKREEAQGARGGEEKQMPHPWSVQRACVRMRIQFHELFDHEHKILKTRVQVLDIKEIYVSINRDKE
jgi:hypothetical protein